MVFKATGNSQSGQILLIVVLAAVVSLTVGLAAVSRTITNTRVSTEEANSQKALAAAEAGVEEQINKTKLAEGADVLPYQGDFSNSSKVIAESAPETPKINTIFPLNGGVKVKQDEGADVWLAHYSDFIPATTFASSDTLKVLWKGTEDCSTEPAIEIVVLSVSKNDPKMDRYALDKCTRSPSNNFTPVGISSEDGYNRQFKIPTPISNGYIMRIIPLYNDVEIAIKSSVALPVQGYTIKSTGTAGGTVRKVQVFQPHPMLPIEFFPYNLFIP
jgi:hypothetical protein